MDFFSNFVIFVKGADKDSKWRDFGWKWTFFQKNWGKLDITCYQSLIFTWNLISSFVDISTMPFFNLSWRSCDLSLAFWTYFGSCLSMAYRSFLYFSLLSGFFSLHFFDATIEYSGFFSLHFFPDAFTLSGFFSLYFLVLSLLFCKNSGSFFFSSYAFLDFSLFFLRCSSLFSGCFSQYFNFDCQFFWSH